MTQKIKSITIIKNFPFSDKLNLESVKEYSEINLPDLLQVNIQDILNYPEFFQIEYEKPAILKRPDGSIISELEEGTEVTWINQHCNSGNFTTEILDKDGMRWMNTAKYQKSLYQNELRNGLIFLREDINLAEKKTQQLTKQLEIQFEIDRLNAEEGWVANYSAETNEDTCYIIYNYDRGFFSIGELKQYRIRTTGFMSEKTAETILAKYSQEELKQYLGIII